MHPSGAENKMSVAQKLRSLALAGLAGVSLVTMAVSATIVVGALTPAHAQVSGEFQAALEPYGEWRRNARWGEVWVPDQRPRGWRPYSVGHWVYTDDWGWFWVSDEDEADWGWVTYHYGRWIFERGTGWFWVPGDEWGPAWVDWRRGESYVGWAPLPPDDVIYEYEADPTYWTFVEPRYVTAPRVRTYFIPPQRTVVVLRSTVVVNRTFRSGARIAVNPGVSPAVIAAASRTAVPTFRVRPRVLATTQGVSGSVPVRPQDLTRTRGAPRAANRAPVITVQRTSTVIQPVASIPKPEALGKDERGRLGSHPPRAAQGGAPQPQQQTPAGGPAPLPSGQRPSQAPALAPATPPPPVNAQPRPEPPRPAPLQQDRRESPRPPAGSAPIRQGEPPPQVKPVRPIAPQTPPPPPPAQLAPRQPPAGVRSPPPPQPAPPPVARPAPPVPPPVARPVPPPPPAARPVAPPPPAAKLPPKLPPKPGEKPPEPPK